MSMLSPVSDSEWAPAKVNLYLHVAPPRADGLHPIESLVQFTDDRAADRLSFAEGESLTFLVEGEYANALVREPDNLVLRAARGLANDASRSCGGVLTLNKALPVAAGLGGGTSDGSAAIRLLNRRWDLKMSPEDILTAAQDLGSDGPVCALASPSFMSGVGEDLTIAQCVDLPVVLVNPNVEVSTGAVYQRFDELGMGKGFTSTEPPSADNAAEMISALKSYRNDLEPAALALCPAIGRALEALDQAGAGLVRMSGSGATCFGLFETEELALQAADALALARPGWWVRGSVLQGGAG